MTDNISAIGNAGSVMTDVNMAETAKVEAAKDQQARQAPAATEINAQQRLVIEPVSSHRFVYKVMDTNTGEVIRQLPNEQVEKMITDPAYQQGGLVKTQA